MLPSSSRSLTGRVNPKSDNSTGKRGRRAARGRPRPALEALETRLAPASNPFFNRGMYSAATDSAGPASFVAAANGNVLIPVRIDHLSDGTNSGMAGADVTLNYNTAVFD